MLSISIYERTHNGGPCIFLLLRLLPLPPVLHSICNFSTTRGALRRTCHTSLSGSWGVLSPSLPLYAWLSVCVILPVVLWLVSVSSRHVTSSYIDCTSASFYPLISYRPQLCLILPANQLSTAPLPHSTR